MDYIRRDLLTSGQLKKYIENDGLRGMTSNPAIFEKAITGSNLYTDVLTSADAKKLDANGLFEKIAIRDVQDACDIFKPVYAETKRRDGYVSLEVSPFLGFDTKASLAEARRLWKAVDRPNVMIKIPGTPEGLPAIRQALEEGININITLLFAQSAYEKVAEAFLSALEARAAKGQDISQIASVASFFVSRIDTLVDSKIDEKLRPLRTPARKLFSKASAARWPLPMPGSLTRSIRNFLAVRVGRRSRQRCADSAPALGQHQHQESKVSRCDVRRRIDRRRHCGHDSSGNL